MIRPWKKVFSAKHMKDFLNANVVGKLDAGLLAMNLDPTVNKAYEEFYATLAWRDLIEDAVICRVLTRSFFSRVSISSRSLTLAVVREHVPVAGSARGPGQDRQRGGHVLPGVEAARARRAARLGAHPE